MAEYAATRPSTAHAPRRRRFGFRQQLGRWLRHRLAVPLLRGRHAPELAARGTMIGLIWAFTPTFGLRMPLVFLCWLLARHVLRWDFNLLLGLAFTWVTNALVTVPVYYGFYVTGQILLGRWHDLSGFASFQAAGGQLFHLDLPIAARLRLMVDLVILDLGMVLWVGALPWAALMGYLGYRCSLRILRARQARRGRIPAPGI